MVTIRNTTNIKIKVRTMGKLCLVVKNMGMVMGPLCFHLPIKDKTKNQEVLMKKVLMDHEARSAYFERKSRNFLPINSVFIKYEETAEVSLTNRRYKRIRIYYSQEGEIKTTVISGHINQWAHHQKP